MIESLEAEKQNVSTKQEEESDSEPKEKKDENSDIPSNDQMDFKL